MIWFGGTENPNIGTDISNLFQANSVGSMYKSINPHLKLQYHNADRIPNLRLFICFFVYPGHFSCSVPCPGKISNADVKEIDY